VNKYAYKGIVISHTYKLLLFSLFGYYSICRCCHRHHAPFRTLVSANRNRLGNDRRNIPQCHRGELYV